ncbi:ferritin-like domain-containing protein [Brevifollis gellanilyticus]|uniref:Chemotaxis protein n=1 Tax=Brevifollis gellanilyticus TaxID=748831 RepID=A0A512MB10_9BACT|nr:PA2169 family four-helix-bundle protein [Brevifollis gellanilyticus]GEP43908.1 chemotaxis protein [Brevifollis gellanilyticus]
MATPLSTLNKLIEILKDGQNGFQAAAADVDNSELKTLFSQYSLQRSTFAGELQALAQSLGESDPPNSGSVAAALHRGWMDIKAAIASKDEHAILAECERGEDFAVAAYKEALEQPGLPMNIVDTIRTQAAQVKSVHDHVRKMRDALAPVS